MSYQALIITHSTNTWHVAFEDSEGQSTTFDTITFSPLGLEGKCRLRRHFFMKGHDPALAHRVQQLAQWAIALIEEGNYRIVKNDGVSIRGLAEDFEVFSGPLNRNGEPGYSAEAA